MALYDFAPIGITVYNRRSAKFVHANNYFCHKIGIKEKQLKTSADWVSEFVHKDDQERTRSAATEDWENGFLPLYVNKYVNVKTNEIVTIYWTSYQIGKWLISVSRYENEITNDWR